MYIEHDAAICARCHFPFQLQIEIFVFRIGHQVREIFLIAGALAFQLDGAIFNGPVLSRRTLTIGVPSIQILPVEQKLPTIRPLLWGERVVGLRASDTGDQTTDECNSYVLQRNSLEHDEYSLQVTALTSALSRKQWDGLLPAFGI